MNKYDNAMMETAHVFSNLSTCKKRKVGAVVAKNNRPVSVGYNGTIPSSLSNSEYLTNNDCEDENGKTKEHVTHAEFNALTFMVRENISPVGCKLYITTKPCVECANLIIHSGVKEVFYEESDKSNSGIELLEKSGISTNIVEV